MKVITECIIDMKTLRIVKEESYEYSGPLTLCKGGGGGGAGMVDYPDYMERVHEDWLDHTNLDTIDSSIDDVMNAALGNSPWTTQDAYDPDADIVQMIAAPNVLQTLVTLLSTGTTLDTLISNVLDDTRIDNVVNEYAADLDARLISDVLPRFNAGMRDINMVVSSAFVIGRANIEENQDRQVAKFSADIHNKAASDDAIRIIGLKLEYQRVVSTMLVEAYRMKIVAKGEQNDTNMKIDEYDALWDLDVFTHGGNLLAAIGGGVQPRYRQPSTAQSMLGGAMSGAAMGAMASGGNPYGIAAGAFLGAAAAYMQ